MKTPGIHLLPNLKTYRTIWIPALLFILLLGLMSCATTSWNRPLQELSLVSRISTAEPLFKAVYSERTSTIYGLSKDWQMIHFYREQKRLNSIGGLGTGRAHFQRLSDIAVDPDGSLLTLDSASKKISKFNAEGQWSGEIELRGTANPELFVMSGDQTLYVYDSFQGEIICYAALDNSELYRFGKFQLYRISNLNLSREHLIAYSEADNQSLIYSRLGQLVRTEKGQSAQDDFGNFYNLEQGFLRSGEYSYAIGQLTNPILSYNGGNLIVAAGTQTLLLKPMYHRNNTAASFAEPSWDVKTAQRYA
ncbi:MAG: hypothetical protein U1C33_03965 [Candidatus Cloacimonadaceae bacterium]|nr:hypothetical protein [Candidatus Cloacimonadaceae bacterium]